MGETGHGDRTLGWGGRRESDTVPTSDQQMFMERAAGWSPQEPTGGSCLPRTVLESVGGCCLLKALKVRKTPPHSQIIWGQNVGTSSKGSHVFPQALE